MTFTVTRTGDAQAAQTVNFATSIGGGDTAATSDFTATTRQRQLRGWRDQQDLHRADHGRHASMKPTRPSRWASSNATGGATHQQPRPARPTGTITDNDSAPVFSIANASITEGGSDDLHGDAHGRRPGGADGGLCHLDRRWRHGGGGRLHGDHRQRQLRCWRDQQDLHRADHGRRRVYEANETFTVGLANATGGATISATAGTATGTITDNDSAPVFSIANASITEGGQMTFTVTRTGDAQAAQTVNFATSIGGGDTAAAGDFTATTGSVSFAAGETSKTFTVQTTADTRL